MKQGQLIATNGSAQRQAGTVNPHLRKELADQVKAAWRESVRGILDTARLLHKARTDLRLGDEQSFGEWLVEQEIPLSVNTAYRIAKIAENEAIREMGAEDIRTLPQSWATLYELQKIPPAILRLQVETGVLTPDLTLRDARKLVREAKGCSERKHISKRPQTLKDQVAVKTEELQEEKAEIARLKKEVESRDAHIVELEAARETAPPPVPNTAQQAIPFSIKGYRDETIEADDRIQMLKGIQKEEAEEAISQPVPTEDALEHEVCSQTEPHGCLRPVLKSIVEDLLDAFREEFKLAKATPTEWLQGIRYFDFLAKNLAKNMD